MTALGLILAFLFGVVIGVVGCMAWAWGAMKGAE